MSEYVDFHYMPLEGKITGKQVLKQTEDAINDLGNKVYSLDIDQSEIDEAVEKSNEAINTANSALSAVTTGRSVWFNNVAEMVATDIEAGVTAETKGYYVANDGGNALYLIRQEKSGDVVDGGSLIALNNGNMAELVTDGTVNVKQFGAIGNGTDDDTTVFQNTYSYAQAKGFVPFVGVATYKITGSVTGTFNSFGEVTITGGGSVDIINLHEVVSDVSDIRDEVVDETASAKAYSESAATSATNASNSASSASTTATQLMAYLETKETLTAPAVDPTLTISGAAADAKVTGGVKANVIAMDNNTNKKVFFQADLHNFSYVPCKTGIGINNSTKVIDVDIPNGTSYTIEFTDPDSCINGAIAFYAINSGGSPTLVGSKNAGVKASYTASFDIKGFSLYVGGSNVINTGSLEISVEYNSTANSNSLENVLNTAMNSISNTTTNIALTFENGILTSGADGVTTQGRRTVGYIPVYNWTKLTVTNSGGVALYLSEYDANRVFIKSTSYYTNGNHYPTDASCKYVRFYLYSATIAQADLDQYASAYYQTEDRVGELQTAQTEMSDTLSNLLDAKIEFMQELYEVGATVNNEGNATYIRKDIVTFDVNSTDVVGVICDNVENISYHSVVIYEKNVSDETIKETDYSVADTVNGIRLVPTANTTHVVVRLYPSATGGLTDTTAKYYNLRVFKSSDGRFAIKPQSSADPLAVPAYYLKNNYLENKVSAIETLMKNANGNYDAFIFCTDQHWRLNAKNSPKLIHYICERLNIPRMFLGGDIENGIDLNVLNAFKKCFKGNIYNVIGNHEYMDCFTALGAREDLNAPYTTKTITNSDVWAYITSNMTDAVSGDFERSYYYVDNPMQKMRYIVLAVFTDNGTSAIYQFETAQKEWLRDVALNLPAGYTAVIFAHYLYGFAYNTDGVTETPPGTTEIANIVDSYSGGGTIACLVAGHTHVDGVTKTPGGVPAFVTTCDKYYPWIDGGTNREPWFTTNRILGTITEQAFDVVVIDKTNRLISFVRIGAPADNGSSEKLEIRQQSY